MKFIDIPHFPFKSWSAVFAHGSEARESSSTFKEKPDRKGAHWNVQSITLWPSSSRRVRMLRVDSVPSLLDDSAKAQGPGNTVFPRIPFDRPSCRVLSEIWSAAWVGNQRCAPSLWRWDFISDSLKRSAGIISPTHERRKVPLQSRVSPRLVRGK